MSGNQSENQKNIIKSFPNTMEGEQECIRYFVSTTPFMSFEEVDSWLTSPEWMNNINMEVVAFLADVYITKEFYILLKACYDNNTNKDTLKRLGVLLLKDGLNLRASGNVIYENPMKRLQDAYYILGYIVQIRMKKCKTIENSNLYRMKINIPANLNYAWDGIGTWRC